MNDWESLAILNRLSVVAGRVRVQVATRIWAGIGGRFGKNPVAHVGKIRLRAKSGCGYARAYARPRPPVRVMPAG